MKSLKDFFFEDENKFVKVDYSTVVNTNNTDNVNLADPININFNHPDTDIEGMPEVKPNEDDILPGGADVKLVGEIRLFSETSSIFNERKRIIADKFRNILKNDEVNANRIKCTKIFSYYITHLINAYKKEIDNNCRLNVSSKNELIRQLSDDFVLLIRKKDNLID